MTAQGTASSLENANIPPRPRVLVCGGRDFTDSGLVYSTLFRLDPTEVIEGGATGADRIAAAWPVGTGRKLTTFEADWSAHGRAAGPRRNQQMLSEGRPDVVLAFSGGRGTADMVARAKAAGVPVLTPAEVKEL